jgi:hypothetical protein
MKSQTIRRSVRCTLVATALATALLTAASVDAIAAGYTGWAVPTRIALVNNGVLISGSYRDVNRCGNADLVFYHTGDARYQETLSMAYAALAAGKELAFYVDSCVWVSFHNKNVNRLRGQGPVFIR